MKDYSKAKIYTIRNLNDKNDIYVGSTIQNYLCQRWAIHLQNYRQGKNCLLYQRMRETNIIDWYIELYEAYPCNSKDELLKREGEIIREIGTLNSNIAGRSSKDWYIDNKETILNRMKGYYELHRDTRLAYQNDYNHKKNYKAKFSTEGGFDDDGLVS
jgi:hypothetical protein